MIRSLHLSLCVLFLTCFTLPTFAQVKRVGTANPLSIDPHPYDMVYEYDIVDIQPQFPGGEREMTNFINKIRKYPYQAYKKGIEGRVLCSFIISEDGAITHVRIIRGVDESLNQEAARILRAMPKWKAGVVDGAKVAVHCILPIVFRL